MPVTAMPLAGPGGVAGVIGTASGRGSAPLDLRPSNREPEVEFRTPLTLHSFVFTRILLRTRTHGRPPISVNLLGHGPTIQPQTRPTGLVRRRLGVLLIVRLVRATFIAGSWLCAALLFNGAALEPPWRDTRPYVLLAGLCALNGLLLVSRRPVQAASVSTAEAATGSSPGRSSRARKWTHPLWASLILLRGIFEAASWLFVIIVLTGAAFQPALDRQALVILSALSAVNALLLHPRRSELGRVFKRKPGS